jgi:hypothetical protein
MPVGKRISRKWIKQKDTPCAPVATTWYRVTIAVVIAAVSSATLFFTEFSPNNDVERHGVSMITAAVVEKSWGNRASDRAVGCTENLRCFEGAGTLSVRVHA